MFDCTRSTRHSSSCCLLSAVRTFLQSAAGKIFVMFLPVTGLAEGQSVRGDKPEIGIFSPRHYMVSVQPTFDSATSATVAIPVENCFGPFASLWSKSRSFIEEGRAIFPSRRLLTNGIFSCTTPRAELSRFVIDDELFIAVNTFFRSSWSPHGPASLAAIFRVGTIEMSPITIAANGTFKNHTTPSAKDLTTFWNWHGLIITNQEQSIKIEPRYCDVIVKRWEKLTGKEATRG
jgi:hypothetical protein